MNKLYGHESDKGLDVIVSLPGKIRANGLKVPTEFEKAVKALGWSPRVNDDLSLAEAALDAAKTQGEFTLAMTDYASAFAMREAARSPEVQYRAAVSLSRRVYAALPSLEPVLGEAIDLFDKEAPKFTEAALRLPNLDGLKVTDIDPETASAIADAKTSAEKLSASYGLYLSLLAARGEDVGKAGGDRSDGLTVLLNLCQPVESKVSDNVSTQSALWTAVDQLRMYAQGDSRMTLGMLAPFIVPVNYGWELKLATPAEADERRRRLFGDQ